MLPAAVFPEPVYESTSAALIPVYYAGYHQARVKLGDYYYYGMGTEVSYEAAAAQYRMASDKMSTPQAMFNLGYMYEHGEGLEKVSRRKSSTQVVLGLSR